LGLGSAVKDACEKLKAQLLSIAPGATDLGRALAGTGIDQVSADGTWKPHGDAMFDAAGGASGYSMHTWGAIFVEVAVDEALGLVRMRRAVAGYSAGRIVNPRTARSQMIGGIVWGYGQALLEESAMDERYGRYLSKNLSGVMLPVNADIAADIDVFFIDEFDPHASSIGARGIGELGATALRPPSPTRCGTPPASACASCRFESRTCLGKAQQALYPGAASVKRKHAPSPGVASAQMRPP